MSPLARLGEGRAQIGLLLPTREAAITGADAEPRFLLDLACHAESVGFDSVFVGDSLLARPRLEPLSLLAAIATVTTRVTIGTAALTGALRHPLLAAHSIATVDRLAEGRLVLGLGGGFPYPETEAEFAAVGVPFDRRIGRLLETVALWRTLWAEPSESLSFVGNDWQFEDLERLPRPARQGGPPLWYAGGGPRALRLAARHFDGWLPYLPTPTEYDQARVTLFDEVARAGREPAAMTCALYVTVLVSDDLDRAGQQLETYCQRYYGAPLELMEALQAFVYGPAEQVASTLSAYVKAGATHIVVRIGSLTPSAAVDVRVIHRGCVRVIPRLVPGVF